MNEYVEHAGAGKKNKKQTLSKELIQWICDTNIPNIRAPGSCFTKMYSILFYFI